MSKGVRLNPNLRGRTEGLSSRPPLFLIGALEAAHARCGFVQRDRAKWWCCCRRMTLAVPLPLDDPGNAAHPACLTEVGRGCRHVGWSVVGSLCGDKCMRVCVADGRAFGRRA